MEVQEKREERGEETGGGEGRRISLQEASAACSTSRGAETMLIKVLMVSGCAKLRFCGLETTREKGSESISRGD